MDNIFRSLFNSSPVDFVETPQPSQTDIQEPAGGGTGPEDPSKPTEPNPAAPEQSNVASTPEGQAQPAAEQQTPGIKDILQHAQEVGAEKTQENKEKWAERKSKAKEKATIAWEKTKEVNRETADTIKGLTDKDVRGELGQYILDKLLSAKDILSDKKIDIWEKTSQRRETALTKTDEKHTALSNEITDRLVTRSEESQDTGVKGYFVNKGRNMVDRHLMNQAFAQSDHAYNKGERIRWKMEKREAKLEKINRRKDRQTEGSSSQQRLERKSSKLSGRIESSRNLSESYKNRSQQTRENGVKLWTDIKAGKKK